MCLPELIYLEDSYGVDTAEKTPNYIEDIYDDFLETAVNVELFFLGKRVTCPYHIAYQQKHYSFWHCMSTAREETPLERKLRLKKRSSKPKEEDRIPDLARCERIRWIGWTIQRAEDPAFVRWWENERPTRHGLETHVPLWLFNHEYAVILRKMPDCYAVVTSYHLKPGRAEAFEVEWRNWTG